MMHWQALTPALPSPKVEDGECRVGDIVVPTPQPLAGSSERMPLTPTNEVQQLLDDASRWMSTPLSTTKTLTATDSNAEQPPEVEICLQPIQFWDGYEGLKDFPNTLKVQLEQACASQKTETPSCVKRKWPKTYAGGLSSSNQSHVWYDYKTGQELLVSRFSYGAQQQVLIAEYARNPGTPYDNQPFVITWAGGTWRRWDPEGFIHEPQHIERESKGQLDTICAGSRLTPVQSDAGDAAKDMLKVENPNGTQVQLKCYKCDAQTYNTRQGLFFHLRYSHGIFLKSCEEVVKVCGTPLKSTPRQSKRGRKRKRSFDSPPAEQNPPIKPHVTREQGDVAPLPINDNNRPMPSIQSASATTNDNEISFVFKKSDNDETLRIRPFSACDSVAKLMVNALIAGIANKDTLMFTIEINNNTPIYVMRGDTADFGQVLGAINGTHEKNIAVVVTVEDLC